MLYFGFLFFSIDLNFVVVNFGLMIGDLICASLQENNCVLGSFSNEKIVVIYYNRQIGPKIIGYVLSHIS
jgi:hypothetical protein